jgi:hypothetical protein
LLAPGEDSSLRRFPLRTQLLMLLALAAFVRLWCATHPTHRASRDDSVPVEITVRPNPRGSLPDAGAASPDAG